MYMQLFELLAEAVTVREPKGTIVYANRAALRHLGFDSLQELRERATTSIMDDYVVEDERGRPLVHNDVPSIRLIRGERADPMLMRTVHRGTGVVRWNLLKATPLLDDDGQLLGAMTVIEDVTAVKTAELRTAMLAESGRILASSLDYQQTLRNVAEIAVPTLADYCSLDLVDEHGALERVVATHRDPARRDLTERLAAIDPNPREPDHPSLRVLNTGTSELYQDLGDEHLVAVARNEQHLDMLRGMGMRSMLIVPMRVPRRTIGLMTLATDVSHRRLDADDTELAEQLARRAAVAVENSRLHTKLTEVAETLQLALLPAPLPEIPGWEVASLYRPTETELRIDVGGDFYELFDHEGRWFVIIGDVAGKGVTAASVAGLMRHGARVASRAEPEPAAILARLDEVLAQQAGVAMATAMCMCLHHDRVVISSAGHPPAIIVQPDGGLREAPDSDALLGAFRDSDRHDETVPLGPDELLVLYTDGVIDAPGSHERFGAERLRRLLADQAGRSPAEVLDRLDQALDAFTSGSGVDDVAALALRPSVR
jgi:PAS domain S-box-containing protein